MNNKVENALEQPVINLVNNNVKSFSGEYQNLKNRLILTNNKKLNDTHFKKNVNGKR